MDILSLISYAYLLALSKLPINICQWIFIYYSWQRLHCLKGCLFLVALQGLKSEGLYRISGFSDSVEEVKMGFDKGLCSLFYRLLTTQNMTAERIACLHMSKWDTKLLRLMKNWHISEGLASIWECRSHSDISLSCRISVCGQTRGISGVTNHGRPPNALNVAVLGFSSQLSKNKPALGQCSLNFNCKRNPADWTLSQTHMWEIIHDRVSFQLTALWCSVCLHI